MAKTNSLEIDMSEILDEVSRNCKDVYETDSLEVAKETVQKLKNTSPRKAGDYAKGWKVSKKRAKGLTTLIVHNATNYQLTHLLENGHDIVNKKGRYGVSRPIKHIGPAEEWASEELPRKIMEDLEL